MFNYQNINAISRFVLILFYLIVSINLFAQLDKHVDKPFFDSDLDYHPRIISRPFSYDSVHNTQGHIGIYGEFSEELSAYMQHSLDSNIIVKRFPSVRMHQGISPPILRKNIWMKIEIDSEGKLKEATIYGMRPTISQKYTEDLSKFLEACRMLPGLKNGKKVRSIMYFIVTKNC